MPNPESVESNPFIAKIEAAKQSVRAEADEARAKRLAEIAEQQSASSARTHRTELGIEWINMTNELKDQALRGIPVENEYEKEVVRIARIIPDGNIPDAHRNEIELSDFKKKYL
jgi:hypothetical protein